MKPNKRKTIGFVSDLRRINVSLSRAKNLCVIVCDAKRLAMANKIWNNIMTNAVENNQMYYFENKKDYFKNFKANPEKFKVHSLDDIKLP